MTLKEELLSVSDAFAAARGVSRSRVSTIVLNRGSTLDAIAAGRADVTTTTFESAMLWFSVHWPADLSWPADISRPQPERSAAPDDFDANTPPGVEADHEPFQARVGHLSPEQRHQEAAE